VEALALRSPRCSPPPDPEAMDWVMD